MTLSSSSTSSKTRPRPGNRSSDRSGLTWGTIGWQALWLGILTLVTTAVMFCFLPRHGSFWKSRSTRGQRTVGFSEEINLETLGPILESPEMVMRVSFSDPLSNLPYRIWGEPYFRGAVLTEYIPGKGSWRRRAWETSTRPLPAASSMRHMVRQDITLEPGDRSVIFSIAPVAALRETSKEMLLEANSLTVVPKDTDRLDPKAKYRFISVTSAFQQGIQHAMLLDDPTPSELSQCQAFEERYRDNLPTLIRIAQEILDKAKVDPADQLGKVRALESHFLAANRYQYSLNNSAKRNTSIDPIEDFVSQHHTGHCEYFASALALMLRSQNIPARIVIGYKGGEFNSVGNYYQFRQLHAHAWVECFFTAEQLRALKTEQPLSIVPTESGHQLPPEEVPPQEVPPQELAAQELAAEESGAVVDLADLLPPSESASTAAGDNSQNSQRAEMEDRAMDSIAPTTDTPPVKEGEFGTEPAVPETGGWLRLDPTPDSGDPLEGIRRSGLLGRLGHLADYAQLLWNDYVLGLDSQRQRESIYRPLVSGARATLEGLFDRAAWESWWESLMTSLGLSPSAVHGPANYIIRMVVGLLLSLLLLAFLLRRKLLNSLEFLWRLLSGGGGRTSDADDFYRRLERLLARLGSVRAPGQTPRELVRQSQPLWADSPYEQLPESIVEAFYRIRFGGQSLDKVESEQLQHALSAWERDLAGKRAL